MMAAHDDCIIIDAGIVGWAWMLFAEQPGLMAVLGGGLILFGVVCGRGRNPTLRLWPTIFSGKVDVLPSEGRDVSQEIGR
jgi:hypothetical protein